MPLLFQSRRKPGPGSTTKRLFQPVWFTSITPIGPEKRWAPSPRVSLVASANVTVTPARVRLLQFERHARPGVLAPLESGGVRRTPFEFEVGLVLLKLLLRLVLPPGAKERLGQQVMRRRVEMVRVQRKTFWAICLLNERGWCIRIDSRSG